MWWKYYLVLSTTILFPTINGWFDILIVTAQNDKSPVRQCGYEKLTGVYVCKLYMPQAPRTLTELERAKIADIPSTELPLQSRLTQQQQQQLQWQHQQQSQYQEHSTSSFQHERKVHLVKQSSNTLDYASSQPSNQPPQFEFRGPSRRIAGQQQQATQQIPQQIPQHVPAPRLPIAQPQPIQQTTPFANFDSDKVPRLGHMAPPPAIQIPNTELISQGFTIRLHDLIFKNSQGSNVVYSPISIHTALALIYTGASGQTAQELQAALDLPNSKSQVKELFAQLPKSQQKGEFLLKMFGKFYYAQQLKLLMPFVDNARDNFNADVAPINFGDPQAANKINQWVARETNNRINNLVTPQSLDPRSSAVYVNAIYFKAKWFNEFSADETTDDQFYLNSGQIMPVRMMNNEDNFRYAELPQYKAKVIQLPYRDTDLSMMIILPNDKNGLAAMEAQMQNFDLRSLLRYVTPETVKLQLPNFRVEFDLDLVEALQALNIKTVFTNRAELFGIFPDNSAGVSSMKHKAFIDVNEAGSEAAAATFTKFIPLSLPSNVKEFRVDHPFMFAIIGPHAVYFVGHVVRP